VTAPGSIAPQVVLVTGASSGFGRLTAAGAAAALAEAEGLTLSAVELDVQSQSTVDAAVESVIDRHGRLDVIVHNAGHMVLGPAEAFSPEQLAELYDVNVLGTQRVNRAALPHLRAQRSGLLVWVGSSSTRGGHPPFLAPYFAAKAGMDALAESYASELVRFGIDTSIVVPGAFTSGTNHFLHAGTPSDHDIEVEYDAEYGTLREQLPARLAGLEPEDADDLVGDGLDLSAGARPFRVHVDPSRDGSEVVSVVADRVRADFYRRIGLDDLLPRHASL
jgi:NAD(P)-dependent dehydrogenase (short-subunit alcohol dehydrogenase family)